MTGRSSGGAPSAHLNESSYKEFAIAKISFFFNNPKMRGTQPAAKAGPAGAGCEKSVKIVKIKLYLGGSTRMCTRGLARHFIAICRV
jgi:hypothetical protein